MRTFRHGARNPVKLPLMAMPRKGRRQIVVDGQPYFWRTSGDDYLGNHVDAVIVDAAGARPTIRIRIPYDLYPLRDRHWWEIAHRATLVTPRVIARAIQLRRGREDVPLESRDLAEMLGVLDEIERDLLVRASEALGKDRDGFLRAFIGIGCTQLEPARVDDWIASHAYELVAWRPELQASVDQIAHEHGRRAFERRSAIEFLVAASERVSVDTDLDTRIVDARLATLGRVSALPWGIPDDHWWWVRASLSSSGAAV